MCLCYLVGFPSKPPEGLMTLGSQGGRGSLLPDCSSKYIGRRVPPMPLSTAVGQIGGINHNTSSKSPQWAATVMGIRRRLLSSSGLGESPCLAQRRVEERNFLISIAGHRNPSCRTERKNWDGKLFCSFKPCWGMASSA